MMTCINPRHPHWRYVCGGCVRPANHDPDDCLLVLGCLLILLLVLHAGCVPSQQQAAPAPFQATELEACLTVVVDMSGSFTDSRDQQAYPLLVELMDRFFTHGAGGETRVVIAQLSGAKEVVLFEGRPADLRAQFRAPEELADFLHERSDPRTSPVYRSIGRALAHVNALPGVTEKTRLMTVVLSDLDDSEHAAARHRDDTHRLVRALKRYQQLGGALALYCVAPDETTRWRQILELAGFAEGRFVIESDLVARPTLPSFE